MLLVNILPHHNTWIHTTIPHYTSTFYHNTEYIFWYIIPNHTTWVYYFIQWYYLNTSNHTTLPLNILSYLIIWVHPTIPCYLCISHHNILPRNILPYHTTLVYPTILHFLRFLHTILPDNILPYLDTWVHHAKPHYRTILPGYILPFQTK